MNKRIKWINESNVWMNQMDEWMNKKWVIKLDFHVNWTSNHY